MRCSEIGCLEIAGGTGWDRSQEDEQSASGRNKNKKHRVAAFIITFLFHGYLPRYLCCREIFPTRKAQKMETPKPFHLVIRRTFAHTAAMATLLVVSDIHYASAAEQARRGYEAAIITNPLLRAASEAYRHFIWLRDPLAHNHLLEKFLDQSGTPDLVVANGDYSCDSAFIGVCDDAAFQSAQECLKKLRGHFGEKLLPVRIQPAGMDVSWFCVPISLASCSSSNRPRSAHRSRRTRISAAAPVRLVRRSACSRSAWCRTRW